MTTPKGITYVVVGTLAFLSCVYILTLAYCTVNNITIEGDTFKIAGAGVLGAFTGLLVNTRSQQDANTDARTNLHSTGDAPAKSATNSVTLTNTTTESKSDSVAATS